MPRSAPACPLLLKSSSSVSDPSTPWHRIDHFTIVAQTTSRARTVYTNIGSVAHDGFVSMRAAQGLIFASFLASAARAMRVS